MQWIDTPGLLKTLSSKGAITLEPLRSDGEGIYRFADGSYVELLLDYDTLEQSTCR